MDPAVIESSNHPMSVIYKKKNFALIMNFRILFRCVCDHVRRKMEVRAAPITEVLRYNQVVGCDNVPYNCINKLD